MTIKLSTLGGGGGGVFVPRGEIQVVTVSSGLSGELFSFTPAAGNIMKTTRIYGSGVENNITVKIETLDGPVEILSDGTLDLNTAANNFFVGGYDSTNNLNLYKLGSPEVFSSGLTITKNSGSTTNNVIVVYQEGKIE